MALKIALLGPFPPPHGGVESNIVAIREYARRCGHRCAVINLRRHRREDGDDVYYPHSAYGVLRLLWNGAYDVIHLHVGGELPRRLVWLGLVCSLLARRCSLFTFHSGGFPSSPEGRAASRWSLTGFVMRRFDYVVGVNRELIDVYRRWGVAADRARLVLPYAVGGVSAAAPVLPEPLLGFFGTHKRVFVTVGQLLPEYDLPLQIAAMEQIVERYPGTGLAILGPGDLEGDLRRRIADSPAGRHILLCGDVGHKVALRAIVESDGLLRSTLYDGDAISVREALYLDTPVIATDTGMRPGGVRLFPIGNEAGLVQAMAEVLSAPRREKVLPEEADEGNVRQILRLYGAE